MKQLRTEKQLWSDAAYDVWLARALMWTVYIAAALTASLFFPTFFFKNHRRVWVQTWRGILAITKAVYHRGAVKDFYEYAVARQNLLKDLPRVWERFL